MSELRAEVRDLIEVKVKDDIVRAQYHLYRDETS
jgi:hypothetical protein